MSDNTLLKLSETSESRATWARKPHISPSLQEELLIADVLLVPTIGFLKDSDLIHFPSGTESVFHFLRSRKPEGININICIEDEDYQELALHADLLVITTTIVSAFCVGVSVELFKEYIKYKLGSREENTNIKWDLIVEDDVKKKTFRLSYYGPANNLEVAMRQGLEAIQSGHLAAPAPTKRNINRVNRKVNTRRRKKK